MFVRSTRVLGLVVLMLACCCFVEAQDRIKLSASYLNTEFQANPIENLEYLRGVSVDADARIFSKGGFRLGGVFSYQRVFDQQIIPVSDVYPNGIYRDVDTYAVGAQLSYRAGPVEPFGALLFGARKPREDRGYNVVRKYRVGLDVLFHKESNFFVRPFFVEFEATGGFNSDRSHKYGAGAGARF